MKWEAKADAGGSKVYHLPMQLSKGTVFSVCVDGEKFLYSWQAGKLTKLQELQARGISIILEKHFFLDHLTSHPGSYSNEVQVLYGDGQHLYMYAGKVGLSATLKADDKMQASQRRNIIKSPLNGKVLQVFVKKNSQVKRGDALAVIEAMKMENQVQANTDGKITSINIVVGDSVKTSDPLFTLEK